MHYKRKRKQIRERLVAGEQGKSIANDFGVKPDAVSRIKTGRTWKQ
jgi:FixJ family two-component response regulator